MTTLIVNDIQEHCLESPENNRVWVDASNTNLAIVRVIPKNQLEDSQNAITSMKASKNTAELEGMKRAHLVDGAAMAEFISWLERTLQEEERTVSEVEIDTVLTSFRAKQAGFLESSFPTIAGVGSNGAIIHYRAQDDTPLLKELNLQQPILLDSGGQYEYGTTDVTRTWHFGTDVDEEFIDSYTRVLKGNIALDTAIFPVDTPGFVLDVLARQYLWQVQKEYGHGTGHGVGAALNVHEGPQSISPRFQNKSPLKEGMIVSNEPGYYEDGVYGIRIENLLAIVKHKKDGESDDDTDKEKKIFLKFEKLTMIPIQKNLINLSLMTRDELDWLDAYHKEVLEKVGPLLEPNSPAMEWLEKSCQPIDRTMNV
eukprot:CAMPEP_0116862506 /NCGR_PEP_ID=MMETSP0418-20121206/23672_1 /TAXON_ID=1158023 /ORGANISM="Astrosyne radiata, Strain 13vi08-1A" /LENGTH=368 /DNA_ID=CAMNT_0004497359 /DNA_START=71 /DNA_END=1177 /DNA_ORIENTATION=+